jgi:hypothetical protein
MGSIFSSFINIICGNVQGKHHLRVIIRLGATAVYTEGPLLEGTFFVIYHYMFRPNWPSSGVTG